MSSGVSPGDNARTDQVLANLFVGSLKEGYGSQEGTPFYTRTVLAGPSAEDDELFKIVAYSAVYPVEDRTRLSPSYVVSSPEEEQAYTHEQLTEVLLGYDDSAVYGTDNRSAERAASLRLQALHPIFESACLLAERWRLPALAVMHVQTESGEDSVEFVAPRQVDSDGLIRYLQLGFRTAW